MKFLKPLQKLFHWCYEYSSGTNITKYITIFLVTDTILLVAVQFLLESEKIDAIRQKNMIQGSFRSELNQKVACLLY